MFAVVYACFEEDACDFGMAFEAGKIQAVQGRVPIYALEEVTIVGSCLHIDVGTKVEESAEGEFAAMFAGPEEGTTFAELNVLFV